MQKETREKFTAIVGQENKPVGYRIAGLFAAITDATKEANEPYSAVIGCGKDEVVSSRDEAALSRDDVNPALVNEYGRVY